MAEGTFDCGKGWGERCSRSKGKRCRCACGGANHGSSYKAFGGVAVAQEGTAWGSATPEPGVQPATDPRKPRTFLGRAFMISEIVCQRVNPGGGPMGHGQPKVELVLVHGGSLELPHQIVRHSPDGFEWGYAGSGPAELALNLLTHVVGPSAAADRGMYQRFKEQFIAPMATEGGRISMNEIISWVKAQWDANPLQANE